MAIVSGASRSFFLALALTFIFVALLFLVPLPVVFVVDDVSFKPIIRFRELHFFAVVAIEEEEEEDKEAGEAEVLNMLLLFVVVSSGSGGGATPACAFYSVTCALSNFRYQTPLGFHTRDCLFPSFAKTRESSKEREKERTNTMLSPTSRSSSSSASSSSSSSFSRASGRRLPRRAGEGLQQNPFASTTKKKNAFFPAMMLSQGRRRRRRRRREENIPLLSRAQMNEEEQEYVDVSGGGGGGGEECVGVGMNVECEIPELMLLDDDEEDRISNSTVVVGVDLQSRDESCVGVGIDASCPVEVSSSFVEEEASDVEKEKQKQKQKQTKKREFPALFYVAPFFLWGTSMVSMKEVLPLTSPMFVATVRLIPAGLILILWAASKNRKFPKNAKGWLAVSLFALVDGAMFQGCLAEGLAKTSAGLGSVIIDSQPLTVAILASLLFGETLGAAGIGGLALGVVGLSLLEIPSETLVGLVSSSGDGASANALQAFAAHPFESGEFWMLLAAQSMAVGTVMVRWVVKYVDPVMATGLHMFLGGVPLLMYSLVSEPDVYENIFGNGALGIADGANLLYASVFGGALAYSLFFYFASSGNLTKLSSLTFLTPVFAVVGGYFALGETLDAQQLVGAAVTLGGIYLVNTNAGGNDEK
jgi:drug/metabolite transporter (DMT)-like permease